MKATEHIGAFLLQTVVLVPFKRGNSCKHTRKKQGQHYEKR